MRDLAGVQRGVLLEFIDVLLTEANKWLARQCLQIVCQRDAAPSAWINAMLNQAQGRSGGRVEQHLVGAKLSQVHTDIDVPAHPGAAADAQTGRAGDFQIGKTVYHVTAAPGESVMKKAEANLSAGLHPVLLVPQRQKARAEFLAEHLELTGKVSILAIEDFFAVNILEMSERERQDCIETLQRIVDEYNRRIEQAETDQSLKIDIR